MKKLDTPEIGDPSVSGNGGVKADGAGARCFAPVPAVEELSEPPVVSLCPPPVVVEPFDFACVPCVPVAPVAEVLPCACWARTWGVVVSTGALPPGGAGAVSAAVVVGVVGVGVAAGASGAGAGDVVSAGGVVSVDVVPVEVGCVDTGSAAPTTAGASASVPKATSSGRITERISGRAIIGSALG